MNRSFRDSMVGGGKIFPVASHIRRGLSVNGASNKDLSDDSLDLFSRTRRSVSVVASDESDVSVKLGRLSVGSAKVGKNGLDDLLSSAEGGKHDYDWAVPGPGQAGLLPRAQEVNRAHKYKCQVCIYPPILLVAEENKPTYPLELLLTPPETPLVPSLIANEPQRVHVAPRSSSLARSASTTKASRLSVSHSESNHNARPARSSSVTRSAVSSTQYSTYSNKSTNILNTSSASVSSYIRPSTPPSRSSSSARQSTPTPTSRPTLSRPSTPSRSCPAPNTTSRPSQNSRPSTPSSRPQHPATLSSPSPRSTSRPSTPTRRNIAPSICQSPVTSASSRRAVTSGRTVASRPSSPDPPVRRTPEPIVPPDFSLETPSNLRTTLPNRPLSAGRSRPGASVTVKGNMDTPNAGNLPRRQSSPIVSRGRLTESSASGRGLSNGHVADMSDSRRTSLPSELSTRKSIKTLTENMGFGRNISKKSLDMAIKHMDIRNGPNGARPLSGSTVFPHSIRSNGAKSHSHSSSSPASLNGNVNCSNNGHTTSENGSYLSRSSENGSEDDRSRLSARLTDADIYESCRYDMILLKEDVKNTNWLHSIDDKLDGTIFENGFEPLPEPFDHL